jgi:hypothetical protein
LLNGGFELLVLQLLRTDLGVELGAFGFERDRMLDQSDK